MQQSSRQLYFRILSHFRPFAWVAVATSVAMMLSSASDVLLVGQLRVVIDMLSKASGTASATGAPATAAASTSILSGASRHLHTLAEHLGLLGSTANSFWIIPAVILLLATVRMLASFAADYGSNWLIGQFQHDLRGRLFAHLLKLPNRFYDHASVGATLSRVAYDTSQVSQAGLSVLSVLVRDSVLVIGYLFNMFMVDWQLSLFCLGIIPLVAVIIAVASRRMRRLSRDNHEAVAEMTRVLDETIGGQRVVKVFGGEQYELGRFDAVANLVRRFNIKQASTSALNSGLIMLLVGVTLSAIIYFALQRAQAGAFTGGAFATFMTSLLAMQTSIKNLSKINEQLQRGLAAAESVFALMDEAPEQDVGTTAIDRARGQIEFRQVSFRYDETDDASRPALNEIDLAIAPGETVALVGSSGSGKTTVASLVPRFYDVSQGSILLDGTDIRAVPLADLRSQIALVSQDVTLFNDTIAANIAYGDAQPDRARIVAASQAAFADEFIRQLPNAYDTLIGENGTRLSGGQRQRLAIARALYKDAPILILDEATSALDTESERQVQAALDVLMKGRTTLIIAHRLSTIENADRIVAMQRGRIIEVGSHAQLLAQNGLYASLYRQQGSGEALDEA